jgi:hypothetical protein
VSVRGRKYFYSGFRGLNKSRSFRLHFRHHLAKLLKKKKLRGGLRFTLKIPPQLSQLVFITISINSTKIIMSIMKGIPDLI